MFTQTVLAILSGILAGTFTGLIPGIHINLICIIVLSVSPALLKLVSPLTVAAFIIAMSVNHTFLDSLPGIFLGAPDSAHALTVLPGHRMLLKGQGYNAVKLTVIGSLMSLITCLAASPLLIFLVRTVYPLIRNSIGYILTVIMAYMILKDKKRLKNALIFSLSASLGLVVLNFPNIKDALFPLLSGLFGFSVLITSIMQKSVIPAQNLEAPIHIPKSTTIKATAGATVVGFTASFLPGFGSSQAAILATQAMRKLDENGFMILVGGINTVNMTLSLITLHVLNKARNGSVIAVSKILEVVGSAQLFALFATALVAGGVAVSLSLGIAKVFSRLISRVNYTLLVYSILCFITALVLFFSGPVGLLVLATATFTGISASEIGVGKNHCMACLVVPVIFYFVL